MSFSFAGSTMALQLISLLVAFPVFLVTAVLCLELAFGVVRPGPVDFGTSDPPSTIVIVPAHNEHAGIAETLEAIFRAAFADLRVLVVADNCTDETATVALESGALVVERNDPDRRGKGFALACAQEYIRRLTNLPAVVTVIDADCQPGHGALQLLSEAAAATGRPVQARYLLTAPTDAPAPVKFSNLAFFFKNGIRQRGLKRLGAPALLNGTGMSFPWPVFDGAALASASLVEDLDLGIALTAAGKPPVYVEQAVVLSEAASAGAMVTQRSRWESGFLSTACRTAPALIRNGLAAGSWPKFCAGIDLLIPPVTILGFLNLCAFVITFLLSLKTGSSLAWLALSAVNVVLAVLLAICWFREGRQILPLRTVSAAPAYLLWKIGFYRRLLWQKPTMWIRTERK